VSHQTPAGCDTLAPWIRSLALQRAVLSAGLWRAVLGVTPAGRLKAQEAHTNVAVELLTDVKWSVNSVEAQCTSNATTFRR
jgi:hypothetical protein